jgi:hypothetical protein
LTAKGGEEADAGVCGQKNFAVHHM